MTGHLLMFDHDGVIADSLDYWCEAFLGACRELGHDRIRNRADFLDLFDDNLFAGLESAGVPAAALPALIEAIHCRLAPFQRVCPVFPGMGEVLAELARHHHLVLITSNHSETSREFLAAHGISAFADIIGSDRDRSKTRKIAAAMAARPDAEAFCIGDTGGDMREGRQAGATAVAVAWGWHDPDRLRAAGADRMVASPRDLLTL